MTRLSPTGSPGVAANPTAPPEETNSDISSWLDLALGEHARLNIETTNRAVYWAKRAWADRDRWAGHGMRLVFIAGAAIGIGHLDSLHAIGDSAYNTFGEFWNDWDAAAAVVATTSTYMSHKNAQDSGSTAKGYQRKMDLVDRAISALLVGSTSVAPHIAAAVGSKAAIAACAPLPGASFAICMWACFARSMLDLNHAIKKTKPEYLLYNRAKKYQAICEKLKDLGTDCRNTPEYRQLAIKQQRLKTQIEALYHCNIDTINERVTQNSKKSDRFGLNSIEKTKLISLLTSENPGLAFRRTDGSPKRFQPRDLSDAKTKAYKKISKRLLDKQRDKVKKRAWYASTWGLAAIGMTMIAFAPLCPALLVPGVVIAGVAAASKLGEFIADVTPISDIVSRLWRNQPSLGKLEQQMQREIAQDKPNTLDDPDQPKQRVLELIKEHKPSATLDNVTQYIDTLNNQQKQRLYQRANRRYTENRLLKEALDNDGLNALNDHERESSLKNILEQRYLVHKQRVPAQQALLGMLGAH